MPRNLVAAPTFGVYSSAKNKNNGIAIPIARARIKRTSPAKQMGRHALGAERSLALAHNDDHQLSPTDLYLAHRRHPIVTTAEVHSAYAATTALPSTTKYLIVGLSACLAADAETLRETRCFLGDLGDAFVSDLGNADADEGRLYCPYKSMIILCSLLRIWVYYGIAPCFRSTALPESRFNPTTFLRFCVLERPPHRNGEKTNPLVSWNGHWIMQGLTRAHADRVADNSLPVCLRVAKNVASTLPYGKELASFFLLFVGRLVTSLLTTSTRDIHNGLRLLLSDSVAMTYYTSRDRHVSFDGSDAVEIKACTARITPRRH
ncbi:hypothetical protein FB451DRAFT_1196702 [Mycena latifolia]|nr:hypothetical protein FB451DRAFT_1196702 [Mycena latifolia]